MAQRSPVDSNKVWSVRFLLFIAGLGGLLYGIDVGIIAGALPYLESTALGPGTSIASNFPSSSPPWPGKRAVLAVRRHVLRPVRPAERHVPQRLLFVISIPVIALAGGYGPLLFGRLLQGTSGGLSASSSRCTWPNACRQEPRQRHGHLSVASHLGLVVAALIGLYYARSVETAEGRGRGPRRRCRAGIGRQGPRMAQHLLDVDHPGHHLHGRIAHDRRVGAMAVPPRKEGGGPGRAAADAERRGSRSRNSRNGGNRSRRRPADPDCPGHGGDSLLSRKYMLPFVIA